MQLKYTLKKDKDSVIQYMIYLQGHRADYAQDKEYCSFEIQFQKALPALRFSLGRSSIDWVFNFMGNQLYVRRKFSISDKLTYGTVGIVDLLLLYLVRDAGIRGIGIVLGFIIIQALFVYMGSRYAKTRVAGFINKYLKDLIE